MAATRELRAAADLRFGQVGIANVRVHDADPAALQQALELRLREAPALFTRAPVIVDLSFLDTLPADADVAGLLDAVRAAGMLPVGLAYGDSATDALSHRLGVPLIAKFRAGHAPAAAADAGAPGRAAAHPAPTAGTPATAVQHLQPVRSGQQVYAQGTDLIVTGTVANGAEVLADGNIHVYGALRGRAFAGVGGDASTRIFCSEFRAEIVSIAGHYRVFEELPPAFAGHAVQIHLAAGTLAIEPL